MNDKLLPCPFCGSDYVRAIQTSTDAIVICENCGARVGREENAKQIWNSRAETSVHRELAAYKRAKSLILCGDAVHSTHYPIIVATLNGLEGRVAELLAQEGGK